MAADVASFEVPCHIEEGEGPSASQPDQPNISAAIMPSPSTPSDGPSFSRRLLVITALTMLFWAPLSLLLHWIG